METLTEPAADTRPFVVDPTEHLRLVWSVARRYEGCGVEREDLAGAGMFGLLEACRTFADGEGARFPHYACQNIRWAVIDAIRRERRRGQGVGTVDQDRLAELAVDHRQVREDELWEAVPDRTIPLHKLPDREMDVLLRRFGLDGYEAQTREQIGRALGIHQERVRQIEAKAMRRLRVILGIPADPMARRG